MKKLSEILEISMQYNRGFTENNKHTIFMCMPASEAFNPNKITGY